MWNWVRDVFVPSIKYTKNQNNIYQLNDMSSIHIEVPIMRQIRVKNSI